MMILTFYLYWWENRRGRKSGERFPFFAIKKEKKKGKHTKLRRNVQSRVTTDNRLTRTNIIALLYY